MKISIIVFKSQIKGFAIKNKDKEFKVLIVLNIKYNTNATIY